MRWDIKQQRKREMLEAGIGEEQAELSLKAQDLWEKEHESWMQRNLSGADKWLLHGLTGVSVPTSSEETPPRIIGRKILRAGQKIKTYIKENPPKIQKIFGVTGKREPYVDPETGEKFERIFVDPETGEEIQNPNIRQKMFGEGMYIETPEGKVRTESVLETIGSGIEQKLSEINIRRKQAQLRKKEEKAIEKQQAMSREQLFQNKLMEAEQNARINQYIQRKYGAKPTRTRRPNNDIFQITNIPYDMGEGFMSGSSAIDAGSSVVHGKNKINTGQELVYPTNNPFDQPNPFTGRGKRRNPFTGRSPF